MFFEHFRLSRNMVNVLSERYQASQYYHDRRGKYGHLSAIHQVSKTSYKGVIKSEYS